MMLSNLHESDQYLKETQNLCHIRSPQNPFECQDCRYRHKGLCNVPFRGNPSNYFNNEPIKLEEKLEIMEISSVAEVEPVINLNNLFYEVKRNQTIKISPQISKWILNCLMEIRQ